MIETGALHGLGNHWQLPHQAAISRGVGIAAVGCAFGIVTSLVSGGRTAREVLIPTLMGTAFWGTFIGLTTYVLHKRVP